MPDERDDDAIRVTALMRRVTELVTAVGMCGVAHADHDDAEQVTETVAVALLHLHELRPMSAVAAWHDLATADPELGRVIEARLGEFAVQVRP